MVAPLDPCPAEEALGGFLNDQLPADRQAAVGRHIDRCPHCQHRLDALAVDPSGVVARYQQLSSVATSLPGSDSGNRLRSAATATVSFDGLPTVPGFEVMSEIGRGGMGVVYRARHVHMNRLCALKVVIAGCAADARTVQRFLFEAEVLARIRHPQVVQVYDVGTYRGPSGVPIPYLAMELLDGGTLAAAANNEPQPPRTAAALMEGLARAVHAVHSQGIIHRDLKPGNILFQVSPTNRTDNLIRAAVRGAHAAVAKVSDFGLAKLTAGAAELTHSGLLVGTPGYMAPEQGMPANAGRPVGPAADVYAMGAVLYELLAGRPPFDGTDPMSVMVKVVHGRPPDVRHHRPDCPRDLAAVVGRCLHREPEKRYPSAEALADDLARFRADRPTAARPPHPLEQLLMAVRRNPAVTVLTLTLLVVTGLGLGLAGGEWLRAERTAVLERDARGRVEKALIERHAESRRADGRQLRLELDRAARWCEDGQLDRGLDGFLKALELAERLGDEDSARVIRTNLSAWPARLPPRVRGLAHSEQGACRAAAYTPDGKRLVTAGEFGTLTVWDASTGAKLRSLGTGPLHVRARRPIPTYWGVAVNPAGTRIAAGGSDGQVWVWDAEKPWSLAAWPLVGSDADVWAVAFAPDGTLWTGDADGRVRRWEPDTGKLLTELPPVGPPADVTCLLVTDNGRRVVAGTRGGLAAEWDVGTKESIRRYPAGGWVLDLALSEDGRKLALTGTGGKVEVYDRTTGEKAGSFDLGGAHGSGVAFAPDGVHLAAADNDGNVRVWDRVSGVPALAPLRVAGVSHPIRFRPGTAELAVPAGFTVGVWLLPSPAGRPLPADGSSDRVWAVDFNPAGDRLLIARRHLRIYSSDSGSLLRTYPLKTPPLSARFDPHRPRLLRTDRQTWWAVDVETGAETKFDAAPAGGYVTHLEPAPGGRTLLTADPRTVFEWDADTGRPLRWLPVAGRGTGGSPLRAVRYRPDGKELLVAADDRIEFYDPATGERTRPAIRAEDAVLDARYTPDGTRVVAGLRNNAARVWDLATGKPSDATLPHALAVTGVAASPCGSVVLTGSRDGTARFWDAATGLPLGPPLRHPAAVVAVAYSPDGKRVATGTVGGAAAVWPVPPPPAVGTPDELRAKFAAAGVWPDGR